MNTNDITTNKILFSLDIGTRSIIGSVGTIIDNKFEVIKELYLEHEERAMIDGQIHDITLVSNKVRKIKNSLEKELNIELKEVVIAAAGRFLRTVESSDELEINNEVEIDKEIIRSLEMSAVRKAEEEIAKTTEGRLYCVGYSVKNYYLNSYIIGNLLGHKGEKISAEIISTFLPRSVIDSLYTVMDKVGLKVKNLTLEPIAAIEAVVPQRLRLLNIALVDIGAGTSDIAISLKDSISSYGMVPMAGDEVTEVIAQEYLVDFNAAEDIKRKVGTGEKITYTDVLGLENTIDSEDVKKVIGGTVRKIAEAIGSKILDLNGGKAPSAVFLVGGGAHTPEIIENLSEIIGIPPQRIAIKDRQSVTECKADESLGSAGVTVLGIALSAMKSIGDDFIDVILNDKTISLFNSHKHTVMDVLLQADINPSMLISKNGKSIRFTINGKKRLVFGESGIPCKIKINNKEASLDSEVNLGDNIDLEFAQNGKDATTTVLEQMDSINSLSVFLDDKIISIDPVVLINKEEKSVDTIIKDGDKIEIFLPESVGDFKKYIIKQNIELYNNDSLLEDNCILIEGNKIYTNIDKDQNKDINSKLKKDSSKDDILSQAEDDLGIDIEVNVNGENIILKGKKSYIFVDIFNFIDFDLKVPQGNILKLTLNGVEAGYTDSIKNGDIIEATWI